MRDGRTTNALSVVAAVIVLGCGGSEDSTPGGDAGTDAQAVCPAKTDVCPSWCAPLEMYAIDSANECLAEPKIVGCWDGTGGANAQFGCIQDPETNVKYLTPSTSYIKELVKSGEWQVCSTTASQPCP